MGKTRLIAFDLDGTLTQHKTPLAQPNLGVLDSLGEKYKLLMVGAGMCSRIFRQMNGYPIDIIGNYGMQFCTYNAETKALDKVFDMHAPCDRESVERRITALRERFGYTEYTGDNVEYHDSGCVTFPLLGTKADIAAKLAFDPDRSKRKPLYPAVRDAFPDYTVFIGGSSSFDFAPFPYNKYYALDKYCAEYGYSHDEVVYVGDDYGPGGNDEAVYLSDFTFVCVDDYTRFGEYMREYL
mgnify:FL=1